MPEISDFPAELVHFANCSHTELSFPGYTNFSVDSVTSQIASLLVNYAVRGYIRELCGKVDYNWLECP